MNLASLREKYNDDLTHECTSWIVMPDLTGGKKMLLHKNRDSDAKRICAVRRFPEGKLGWMSVSSPTAEPTANMGINTKGLAVAMNSGDLSDGKSPGPGLHTVEIARVLLENCDHAEAAVIRLKEVIGAKNYKHGERGSMWFIADPRKAFIAEHDMLRFAVHEVSSGFAIRANVWHYPEMILYSQRTPKELVKNHRREFAVRNEIFKTGTAYDEPVTIEKIAAASRIATIPEDPECYPLCGKRTNSAATIAIDCEYPETLSAIYAAFGPPRFTAYLPVPAILEKFPEELADATFGDAVFARRDAARGLLPMDQLIKFEDELNKRHAAAEAKAREILRNGGSCDSIKQILQEAFQSNWEALRELSAGR